MFESILLLCTLQYSAVNNLDPDLVTSVIHTESTFNPRAVSKMRAYGLMQVRKMFVPQSITTLQDVCGNIAVGTDILSKYVKSCKGITKGLVCYNRGKAGARFVKSSNDRYVKKVRRYYDKIKLQKSRKGIPHRIIGLF